MESDLIQRAYSFIRESLTMAFAGIYSTKTFEPLVLADREHVQSHAKRVDSIRRKRFPIEIHPTQVQSIIKHIQIPTVPIAQIPVDDIIFACLRSGTDCLTGVSNFNVHNKRDTVMSIDRAMFSLLKIHFTSEQLVEGTYALQISAILKEDFLIVGICRSGGESSLDILRKVVQGHTVETAPKTKVPKTNKAVSLTGQTDNDNRRRAKKSRVAIPSPKSKSTFSKFSQEIAVLEPVSENNVQEDEPVSANALQQVEPDSDNALQQVEPVSEIALQEVKPENIVQADDNQLLLENMETDIGSV